MSPRNPSFRTRERRHQTEYFRQNFAGNVGYGRSDVRLYPDHARLNLWPGLHDTAVNAFAQEPVIQWHQHANHGLSSQACCVNFLMPMAHKPELLSRWVGHALGIASPEMLPVETRAELDWYATFEWIGDKDYLNEGGANGRRKRGANATASDAAVKFRAAGKTQLILIEWKYTEEYHHHRLSEDRRGTRAKRYRDIAFYPNGPIRSDLGLRLTDFFHEPFYQLLRQQMLAWHIERDPASGIDHARVLHLAPARNRDLHRVTSQALKEFGDDAFEAFVAVLTNGDDFLSLTIEQAFAPLPDWPEAEWFPWLQSRYPSLCSNERPA